jgi:hypothetical protein
MLGVMVVPTGIEAEIGGHSGDATSAAHLLAACCDQLILHPNVVNASDFTEQPINSLYVEGSLLDTFLNGDIRLKIVRQNKILVACNEAGRDTLNCVNAMRSLLGLSAEVIILKTPLHMKGFIDYDRQKASGSITGIEDLVEQVDEHEYDALAVHTPIDVDITTAEEYVRTGGINPWGGVEAMLSKEIYWRTGKPTAHAPVEAHVGYDFGVADPRLAPEMLCAAHLGCVLRGLHKAPRPSTDPRALGSEDVDVLVSALCWGTPHKICRERNIPMIFVAENRTRGFEKFNNNFHISDGVLVRSYLEAAGVLTMMRLGRSIESVCRPLSPVGVC